MTIYFKKLIMKIYPKINKIKNNIIFLNMYLKR